MSGSEFNALELTGLLAGGMPPRWIRGLLASYPSHAQWCASPLRDSEDPAWRNLPACDPGSSTLLPTSASYPYLFDLLSDPPPVLFYEGDIDLLGPAVGVIGAREMTTMGASVASAAATHAVSLGAPVVTGLARGVDECAARAALQVGGKVIGILGGSFDTLDERAAALVADVLAADGLVLCEVVPGRSANRVSLMARNRLIAALAEPLVVAEANLPSGTTGCASHAVGLLTPLVVALPPQSRRSHPASQGLLALCGVLPYERLNWPAWQRALAGADGYANAVCETRQDVENAVTVFWSLRSRSSAENERRLELVHSSRAARRR